MNAHIPSALVFDLCEKGAIMKMAAGKEIPHFTDQQTLRYFRQLILAIEYCNFLLFFLFLSSFFFLLSFSSTSSSFLSLLFLLLQCHQPPFPQCTFRKLFTETSNPRTSCSTQTMIFSWLILGLHTSLKAKTGCKTAREAPHFLLQKSAQVNTTASST